MMVAVFSENKRPLGLIALLPRVVSSIADVGRSME